MLAADAVDLLTNGELLQLAASQLLLLKLFQFVHNRLLKAGIRFVFCSFPVRSSFPFSRSSSFPSHVHHLSLAEKEMKPVEFYKKAGISKEHFSKIKNNVDYQPSKSATMAMVLALKLPLDEAEELMAKAGYTFSTALIQDLVVKFFIQEGIFDVDAVNVELYKLGKKPLTNQRVSS